MLDIYKLLFIQYCLARGKKPVSSMEEINKNMEEFSEWILEHADDTEKYGLYLQKNISSFKNKRILEINKGLHDSLSLSNDNVDTLPTSDYSMDLDDKVLVFEEDSKKKLLLPCAISRYGIKNLKVLNYDLLLSHNPYSYDVDDEHKNLSLIHRQGQYDVSFGVFGRKYDHDKKFKLDLIKKFADLLDSEYQISYESDNDLYFASVNSNRVIKEKVKIKI